MNPCLIIRKVEGTALTRLEVVIYADPSAVATIEKQILLDCQKKGIPYVAKAPKADD